MAFESRSPVRHGTTLLLLALALVPAVARASEPSAADRAVARARMDAGHEARARGDAVAALEGFRAADALMHVPSTGMEVARSLADLGKLVDAADAARVVRRMPVAADEPVPFVNARRDAEQLLADLDARIPTLEIHVVGPELSNAEVSVDGVRVQATDRTTPLRLDPGKHTIVAFAGDRRVTADVVLAERERRALSLELPRAPEPAAPPRAVAMREAPARSHALLYAGASIGVLGVAVGATTGLLALARRNDALQQCVDTSCPPPVHGDVDAARAFGNVSTVSFIVAGLGAGLVVFDLIRSRSGASATVALHPSGVSLRGSF